MVGTAFATSHEQLLRLFTNAADTMSGNQGYDVVVDVDDAEVTKYQESEAIKEANCYKQGDLGHTDLQEDLEFHSSSKSSITTKIAYPIRGEPSLHSNTQSY